MLKRARLDRVVVESESLEAFLEIVRDLTRIQIELVAARTSLLNDCFF